MLKESTAHLLLHTLKRNGVTVREPFYHATSLSRGISILDEGFKAKAGGPGNDAYYDNAVCFTRNFDYTQKNVFGGSKIIFVLDRSELKTKYKIYPYNWFYINSHAKELGPEIMKIYREWVKGSSRQSLIEIYENILESNSDFDIPFDNIIKHFRSMGNTAKQNQSWEYEERVSTSNPLTDGVKETYISPKYIKAILIKDLSIAKRFLDVEGIPPVFFYNYRTKGYYPLNSKADIARIPSEGLDKDNLKEKSKSDFHSLNKTTYKKLMRLGIDPKDIIDSLQQDYFTNFKYPQIVEMMQSEAYRYLQDMETITLKIHAGTVSVDELAEYVDLLKNPYETLSNLIYDDKIRLVVSLPNLARIVGRMNDWDQKRFLATYATKAMDEWVRGEDDNFSLILDFKEKVKLNKSLIAYLLSQMVISAGKGLNIYVIRDLLEGYDEIDLTKLPPHFKRSLREYTPNEVYDYILTKIDQDSLNWLQS